MRLVRRCLRPVALILTLAYAAAHEGGRENQKPTKAERDLRDARKYQDRALKKLKAAGRYTCCVKPACRLCLRNGSCNCAANVAKGKGACGECVGGWLNRRGAMPGVDPKSVKLLSSDEQKLPEAARPAPTLEEALADLRRAQESLVRAKRTLIAEKRYGCCVRGGCDECAFEAECPCGKDLAEKTGKGVCGHCADGWHARRGAFSGIDVAEVKLAPMDSMFEGMNPGTAESGWYASGTSQMPRSSPLWMLHRRVNNWSLMLGGQAFLIHTNQTGPRGRDKLFSANWFMPMAARRVGPGTLMLRSMFSLEPLTVTHRRYPMLFQGGETAFDIPIINGQHPHDFFMELGASYNWRVTERVALNFYGGPRGEPTLGPTAYPHRLSASESPLAVLAHHYQDSTHIASNVVAAGLTVGPVTLEASGFHGREPSEHRRWKLTNGPIDSFATRLTVNPTRQWSAQYSIGRINNRELTHPLRDTFRQSASLSHMRRLASGHWATTAIWGRSHDLAFTQLPAVLAAAAPRPAAAATAKDGSPPDRREHSVLFPTRIPGYIYNSYLIESTALLRNKHWVWGRAESTDKDSLLLFREEPFVRLVEEQRYTRLQAFTLGYGHELPPITRGVCSSLGGQLTVHRTPANLAEIYGRRPLGIQVYLRTRLGSGCQ